MTDVSLITLGLVIVCRAVMERVASTTTLPVKMAPSARNAMALSFLPGTLISKISFKPSLKIPGATKVEHGKTSVPAAMDRRATRPRGALIGK